jgi:competence protein ComEA
MKKLILVLVMVVAITGAAGAAVNINTATKEELTSLKGVGDKRAQDIIDYRKKHGPFKSVDDLEKVPGIGPGFMKGIRSQITTGSKSGAEKPVATVTKSKTVAAKAQPAKSAGLKSDKASGKIAAKLTSGMKVQEKKTK